MLKMKKILIVDDEADTLSVTICSGSVQPIDFRKSYSCRGDLVIIPRNEESVAM
jgi:hypothetical protein